MSLLVALQLTMAFARTPERTPLTMWTVATVPNPMLEPDRCNISVPGWFCDPDFLMARRDADMLRESLEVEGSNLPHIAFVAVHNDPTDRFPLTFSRDLKTRWTRELGMTAKEDWWFELFTLKGSRIVGVRAFSEVMTPIFEHISATACMDKPDCTREQLFECAEGLKDKIQEILVPEKVKAKTETLQREVTDFWDMVFGGIFGVSLMTYRISCYLNHSLKKTNVANFSF